MCQVESCEKDPNAKLCSMHRARLRRTGTTDQVRPYHRLGTCSECREPEKGDGLCAKHLARLRRHGDVDTVLKSARPVGYQVAAHVGYSGAHDRVRALRGRAASRACVDCQEPAAHWSYTHADPHEQVDMDHGNLVPYSVNPAYYVPRCVPCHKAFDLKKE